MSNGPEDYPDAVFSGPFPVLPDQQRFLAQVGSCLLEWGSVDNYLFSCCAVLINADVGIALIVYSRTPTMDSRLSLVADLLKHHFPTANGSRRHELRDKFDKICREIKSLHHFRNSIAHGTMNWSAITYFRQTENGPVPTATEPTRLFSVFPSYTRNGPKESIDFQKLKEHQRNVWNILQELRQFRNELDIAIRGNATPSTPSGSAEPPTI